MLKLPGIGTNASLVFVQWLVLQALIACMSSWLQRDHSQVLETLGSLQQALSRNEDTFQRGWQSLRHENLELRTAVDSLWRENQELRNKSAVQCDDVFELQRGGAELRCELSQMRTELNAERTSREKLVSSPDDLPKTAGCPRQLTLGLPDVQGIGLPGASPHTERNSDFQGLLPHASQRFRRESGVRVDTPPRGCLSPPSIDASVVEAENHDAIGRHALRCPLQQQWTAAQWFVDDGTAAIAARHATELAALRARHAHEVELLQNERDAAQNRALVAEARCFRFRGLLERAFAALDRSLRRGCFHAGKSAVFAAWRHSAGQEAAAKWAARVHVGCTQADGARMLAEARLGAADRVIKDIVDSLATHSCFAAWLGCRQAAAARMAAEAQLRAAGSAIRRVRDSSTMRLCLAVWASQYSGMARVRELQRRQMSWLCACSHEQETQFLLCNSFATWRDQSMVASFGVLQVQVQKQRSHSTMTSHMLDKLSSSVQQKLVLHETLTAWLLEVRSALHRQAIERASEMLTSGLVHGRHKVVGFLSKTKTVTDHLLRQRAWLAMCTYSRECILHARQEQIAQARDSMRCTSRRACHMIQGAVTLCLQAETARVWAVWSGMARSRGLSRTIEALQGRVDAGCRCRRQAVLRVAGLVYRRTTLYHVFLTWVILHCARLDEHLWTKALEKLRAQQARLLLRVSEQLSCPTLVGSLWCAWRAWCEVCAAGRRSRVERLRCMEDARHAQQLDRAGMLFMSSSARERLRTSFSAWHRWHSLERRCRDVCTVNAACLDSMFRLMRASALVYIGFIAWRRDHHVATLVRDLDSLQQLLTALYAEGQRQQAFESLSSRLEGTPRGAPQAHPGSLSTPAECVAAMAAHFHSTQVRH